MGRKKHTILIIDDEASVRKILRKCFESESYRVLEAFDRESALKLTAEQSIDLITLDINLDGDDGLVLAKDIRLLSNLPIVMVSGKSELIDTVVGLEVGADDYITKPFHLREVLARVKSVLRRTQELNADSRLAHQNRTLDNALDHSMLCFDHFQLSTATRDLITLDGTHHDLTTAEYNLLFVLARHARQVMSRDQIMDAIKGTDWNPTDRAIDNQIARLRKKLSALGIHHAIKTIRGTGYQFTESIKANE